MRSTYQDVFRFDMTDTNRPTSMGKTIQNPEATDKSPIMKYLSISLVKDNKCLSSTRKGECSSFAINNQRGKEYREKGAFSNERILKPNKLYMEHKYVNPKMSNTKNNDYTNKVDLLFTKQKQASTKTNGAKSREMTPNNPVKPDSNDNVTKHVSKHSCKVPQTGFRAPKKKESTKSNKISLYPVKYTSKLFR